MKVILLCDVKNIGKKNDVVEVSNGYAKNYLIKNKLAVLATDCANSHLQNDLNLMKVDYDKKYHEFESLKKQIEAISLNFDLKAHHGQCFGEISVKNIIDQLENKHRIKITKFMFPKDFKNLKLGRYLITLNLFQDLHANLNVIVNEIA